MSDEAGLAPHLDRQPVTVARAVKIDASEAPGADFTYSVVPQPETVRTPADRRNGSRQRTRLRSGKLVRLDGKFLAECLVHNRSPSGCRLKLAQEAPDFPPSLYFYDDQSELLFQGRVIWHKARELGLRLSPCRQSALHRSILGTMRRKFHALRG